MHIWESLSGRVQCRIVSAAPADFFSRVSQRCTVSRVENIDDLTATFWIAKGEYAIVEKTAAERGDLLTIVAHAGVYWSLKGVIKRPVLLTGMLLMLFLVVYLPTRVLFVGVEGNAKIPVTQILEAAQSCGIGFGASREDVRSEKVKNTLLQSLPQLQWACVNTKGCVAIISVQERNFTDHAAAGGVCDIAAIRDGIITDITTYRGTALCQVGQIVKEGQVLVSGYTDLGLMVKAERAEADVFAETRHNLTLFTLSNYNEKQQVIRTENRYSLLVGKKLINFEKDSGISPAGCGRMYLESYATLPGGFRLPLAFVQERITYYEESYQQEQDADSLSWLQAAGEEIIRSEMIAGNILSSSTSLAMEDGVSCLSGFYRCREMIGRVHNEEAFTDYGKRN